MNKTKNKVSDYLTYLFSNKVIKIRNNQNIPLCYNHIQTKTIVFLALQKSPQGIVQNTKYNKLPPATSIQCGSSSGATCPESLGTPSTPRATQWHTFNKKPVSKITVTIIKAAKSPFKIIFL